MQLQQIVSKFVLLAMLFTVITSPVNAGLLHQMTMPDSVGCHSVPAMACCSTLESASQHLSEPCSPIDMQAHTSDTNNCCADNDCHANGAQFAIISDFIAISVPSAAQVFTEPEGKRQFYYDVILRPPVFV